MIQFVDMIKSKVDGGSKENEGDEIIYLESASDILNVKADLFEYFSQNQMG